jgi:hypothetical protein
VAVGSERATMITGGEKIKIYLAGLGGESKGLLITFLLDNTNYLYNARGVY